MQNEPQPRSEFVRLLERLEHSKRLAAQIGCAALVVAGLLQNVIPSLLPVAALIYLVAITSVLLEIQGRNREEPTIYPSHQEGSQAFLDEIKAAVGRPGRCDLAWIGVTMQSAWLTLESALGRSIADSAVQDLHIRLLQSDPEFLAAILDADDALPQLTREQWQHIESFCRRNSPALRTAGSTIDLAQYAYMPNYHGLLVDGNVLYLATVRWSGRDLAELSVPHEPFERFDRTTERGQYMIELYNSWLDKGFKSATKAACHPEQSASDETGANTPALPTTEPVAVSERKALTAGEPDA